MNRNILVLDGDNDKYKNPFVKWGNIVTNLDKLPDCDLVVFAGGTDVNPKLYGEVPHPMTGIPDNQRDYLEQAVYTRALILEIPMVGICRGAQFLNVMNNGKLNQHIEGHLNCAHTINIDGLRPPINVLGDHHQSMIPNGFFKLLAESDDGVPEVVYWPHSRSLAVQYHPEWGTPDSDGAVYFDELLDKYVM